MKERKSALIVVDAQKIYTDPESEMFCQDAEETIQRINKLVQWYQTNNQMIVYVRHQHKVDGSDLGRLFDFLDDPVEDFNFKEGSVEVEYDDNLLRSDNVIEIVKTRYSSFIGTDLDKLLRSEQIEKVVICGFMTNFCCESTARSGHDLDYYVDFVLDSTGTPGTENMAENEIRVAVGEFLSEGFARVSSTDEWLAEKS